MIERRVCAVRTAFHARGRGGLFVAGTERNGNLSAVNVHSLAISRSSAFLCASRCRCD